MSAAPNIKPPDIPTPPLNLKANALNVGNGLGTVRSNASAAYSNYRVPVAPPSVPTEYLSRQELGIYSSKKELNQSGNADTLSAAYGGPLGYQVKQRPSINNSSLNMTPSLSTSNSNPNEYSGTDTMDRRMAQTYMQQFSMPTGTFE